MPDAALLHAIRAVLAASPFHGEGHRKVWARLRVSGLRTSKRRVLRLMRENNLLAPSRVGVPRGPRTHDGTIIPETVDTMWGTDLTTTLTGEGQVAVFVAVDHCSAECVGIHAAHRATRFEVCPGTSFTVPASEMQERHQNGSSESSWSALCRAQGPFLMPADRVTYPPLDVLKPVVDDVWIVDSGPLSAFGVPLPVRMTVIRLSDGDLWLHSPTRLTEDLAQALDGLGRVRHLVAPNLAHWTFAADWQSRYPGAVTWAAPGLRERVQVRRRGIRLDRDLDQSAPGEWAGEIEQVIVPGAGGFREVDFFHVGSRTLVLTDLVVNLEAEKLPMLLRPAAWLAGIVAPNGKAPIYLRLIIRAKREKAAEAANKLLSWAPERVVFSHGRWFERDGAVALRQSLHWLVG